MCALIYLLYERLRGEILNKREQKQRQTRQEKDNFRRNQRVCVSYCVGMRLRWDILYFFKQKNSTATHLFSCYFDMYFSWIPATISNFNIYIYIYIFNEINATFWRPLNVYKYNTCNVINSFNSVLGMSRISYILVVWLID